MRVLGEVKNLFQSEVASMSMSRLEERVDQRLSAWLTSAGGFVHRGCALVEDDGGGRGFVATEELHEDTLSLIHI